MVIIHLKCVYVPTYICVYSVCMCVCVCVHVCVCACVCVHVYTCVYMCIYVCAWEQVSKRSCIYTWKCIVLVYTHVHNITAHCRHNKVCAILHRHSSDQIVCSNNIHGSWCTCPLCGVLRLILFVIVKEFIVITN